MKIFNQDELTTLPGQYLSLACGQHPKLINLTEDNGIAIYHAVDQLHTILKGHQDQVTTVIELDQHHLLTQSKDLTIRIWHLDNGSQLAQFDVQYLPQVRAFVQYQLIVIQDGKDVFLWQYLKGVITQLHNQSSLFDTLHRLHNNKWLTLSDKQQRLWSPHGKLIHDFRDPLMIGTEQQPCDGFIESDDHSLITIEVSQRVSHWSTEGQLLSWHQADEQFAAQFLSFIKNSKSADGYIKQFAHVADFPHRNSPFSSEYIAQEQIEQQHLDLDGQSHSRVLWNFFNRPVFEPVKNALQSNLMAIRKQRDVLKSQINVAQKKATAIKNRAQKNSWFTYLCFLFTLIPLYAMASLSYPDIPGADLIKPWLVSALPMPELMLGPAAVIATLLLIALVIRRHLNHALAQAQLLENDVALMNALLPCYDQAVQKIVNYRQGLQHQMPIMRDPSLFSGEHAQQGIKAIVDNSLRSVALEQCGLDKDDILFNEQETIVLRDWALLQSPERLSAIAGTLNHHNDLSFWRSSEGELIFAVQFVQYLFLSKDKIDVFSCFYDFISNHYFAKSAYGFFYQDIIGVTKKDVGRLVKISDQSLQATEICLSTASGENLELTIINQETIAALTRLLDSHHHQHQRVGVEHLQQQLRHLLVNRDRGQHKRSTEIDCLEAQLTDVSCARLSMDTTCSNTLAENTLNKIRSKLHVFKQVGYKSEPAAEKEVPLSSKQRTHQHLGDEHQ